MMKSSTGRIVTESRSCMHDEEHYWMDYNKITLWAHVREEMNLWDGDIILEMPSMDDPEIERIYSDYTSGRLDLSITSTSAIIDHYRRELALEERYCFSPRKRKQFQNFLYKLRRRVILLRAAEAALPQRQEEEGDEAPRVETTEDPSIQTNGVSDTTAMATLGDKVPKKGQITGLKQSTTSPCGAMLNFMAFNYEATVQPTACCSFRCLRGSLPKTHRIMRLMSPGIPSLRKN